MPQIKLNIKVTPNAKKNEVVQIEMNELSQVCLKLKVSAPPQDGKANLAVIELISKFYKIPKSHIAITSGWTSKQKTITINGLSKDGALKNSQMKLI